MEDQQIIELYWARSEQAIRESETKYGAFCLSIARNIVDEHKGRIWAQSDGKENNSFIFQIPVYRGETG